MFGKFFLTVSNNKYKNTKFLCFKGKYQFHKNSSKCCSTCLHLILKLKPENHQPWFVTPRLSQKKKKKEAWVLLVLLISKPRLDLAPGLAPWPPTVIKESYQWWHHYATDTCQQMLSFPQHLLILKWQPNTKLCPLHNLLHNFDILQMNIWCTQTTNILYPYMQWTFIIVCILLYSQKISLQLHLTSRPRKPGEPGALSTWWGDLGTHAIVAWVSETHPSLCTTAEPEKWCHLLWKESGCCSSLI